jgi:DNA polymerase-3 subunit delta
MLLSRNDLREHIKRRDFAPVYVLFGPETYLRDLAIKTLTDKSFEPSDFRDFNEAAFSLDSSEDGLQKAIAAANQMPMMSNRRVVRVTEVRISQTGARDTITEADESALSAYLENPAPETVLILVADELNGVRKMGKILREKAAAVEFTRLDDRELADWARKRALDAGATIDEINLRLLLSKVGFEVRRLANEISKLAVASLPSGLVTAELIESLVPDTHEMSNFELTDHLVAGRGDKALKSLRKILDDGAEPLALLGLISYNFRRLLIAKEMMERAAPRQEIASVVKLYGRGQDEFFAAARRANRLGLRDAVERIAKTDLAIKTSVGGGAPQGPRMQIEVLVCSLATNLNGA